MACLSVAQIPLKQRAMQGKAGGGVSGNEAEPARPVGRPALSAVRCPQEQVGASSYWPSVRSVFYLTSFLGGRQGTDDRAVFFQGRKKAPGIISSKRSLQLRLHCCRGGSKVMPPGGQSPGAGRRHLWAGAGSPPPFHGLHENGNVPIRH